MRAAAILSLFFAASVAADETTPAVVSTIEETSPVPFERYDVDENGVRVQKTGTMFGLNNNNMCGGCSSTSSGSADCTKWDITIPYKRYSAFNLFCGCSGTIDADAQCERFEADALSLVESYAASQCGVHLRCSEKKIKSDAEPHGHDCNEHCVGLIIGCLAKCDTKCFYEITCEALIPVTKPDHNVISN